MTTRFSNDNPGTDVVACCPDWKTDDFILMSIHEFLEGGEYAMIICPHCDGFQFVDLPVDAWSIERERNMKFQTEREAANEAIEAEKLTIDEIVARIPEGWMIVSDEHFNGICKAKETAQKRLALFDKKFANWRALLLSAIGTIGDCGGKTHRNKDASLLEVVGLLSKMISWLDIDRWRSADNSTDIDEIPF